MKLGIASIVIGVGGIVVAIVGIITAMEGNIPALCAGGVLLIFLGSSRIKSINKKLHQVTPSQVKGKQ